MTGNFCKKITHTLLLNVDAISEFSFSLNNYFFRWCFGHYSNWKVLQVDFGTRSRCHLTDISITYAISNIKDNCLKHVLMKCVDISKMCPVQGVQKVANSIEPFNCELVAATASLSAKIQFHCCAVELHIFCNFWS